MGLGSGSHLLVGDLGLGQLVYQRHLEHLARVRVRVRVSVRGRLRVRVRVRLRVRAS